MMFSAHIQLFYQPKKPFLSACIPFEKESDSCFLHGIQVVRSPFKRIWGNFSDLKALFSNSSHKY